MGKLCFSLFLVICYMSIGQSTCSIFQPLAEYVSSKLQPFVVPQVDKAKPLMVNAQVGVYAVDDIDRKRNELRVRSWLFQTWNSTITWDPNNFNGLRTIRLPTGNGYLPQVASLASAGYHEMLSPLETRYLFNGMAVFFATVKWKLLCDMSEKDTCVLRMYNSDYANDVVRLRHPEHLPISIKKLINKYSFGKSEYEILAEKYSQGNSTVKGFPGTHDWIQYEFSFRKRRPGYNGNVAIFKFN